MSKTPKIKKSKKAERFDASNELWEAKLLGATAEHAAPVSDKREKELNDAMGLQLLTFRIQKSLIEQLKQLSKLEGIGYQPLMRQILTRYVKDNEHKLNAYLSATETTEKANKLFAQSIKLKDEIHKMKPLSNERIFAEDSYTKALTQAQLLFTQAYDLAADPVTKQHVALRLGQIADLCQNSPVQRNKKYGKAV